MTPKTIYLSKVETTAIWKAVEWMNTVLREWQRDGFKDEEDKSCWEVQRLTLLEARRGLRKVNAIRKAQPCRPVKKLQVKRKTAGGAKA